MLPWPFQPLQETPGQPHGRVSIIIPFKDRVELLRNCLSSLRSSTYRRLELILVNNGSDEVRTQRYLWHLAGRRRVHVLDCPGPFNFSRLCNEGAKRATGDHVLFLNNDIEVLSPDWLERLLLLERHPEVGVVERHAPLSGPYDSACRHLPASRRPLDPRRPRPAPGLGGAAGRAAPGSGGAGRHGRLPARCAASSSSALGGFDERLGVTFGDVDLCRRVRAEGRLVVVTPHARLLHYESLTRGYALDEPEARAWPCGNR